MLRKSFFKSFLPSRYILIPLAPRAGVQSPEITKSTLSSFAQISYFNKYAHLVQIQRSVQQKLPEGAIIQAGQQNIEENFVSAKKFFTALLKHSPMSIVLQIVSSGQVFQKLIEKNQRDQQWQRLKFRNRVYSILSKNCSGENLEQVMELFDKTKSEFINFEFLKSHDIFDEISRVNSEKKLKYFHLDEDVAFDRGMSIVNYNNVQFKNQTLENKPLKPSEHFFYDDQIKEIVDEVEEQQSMYDKLLMKSTYKQQTQKLASPLKKNKKQKKKQKQFEKIILVNNNPQPVNAEYGQKWIYVYGLPFDLQQEHIDKVLKFVNSTEKVVSYQPFSYKELLEVDQQFYDCEVDLLEQAQSFQVPIKNKTKNIQEKLLSRSKFNIYKQVSLNNSYMLLQLKEVPNIITYQGRVFGINYENVPFKLQYAKYKKSLIIKGIPLGIDSSKLVTILNSKLIQSGFKNLTLTPSVDELVKNYNSYAILKFNSFWESMKAIQILSSLKHNGINLKLNHVYGGLKVLDKEFIENFDNIEDIKKTDSMMKVMKNNLNEIVHKKKIMEIDIAV